MNRFNLIIWPQLLDINEELKMMLVDRDDYYMQQDSLLVEVEDVIKYVVIGVYLM